MATVTISVFISNLLCMLESWKRSARAAMVGMGLAASGETLAHTPAESSREHHEQNTASWADSYEQSFDAHAKAKDVGGMLSDVRAFEKEFYFPTVGTIEAGPYGTKNRVASAEEWRDVAKTAQHFLDSIAVWGDDAQKEQLEDVLFKAKRSADPEFARDQEAIKQLQQELRNR